MKQHESDELCNFSVKTRHQSDKHTTHLMQDKRTHVQLFTFYRQGKVYFQTFYRIKIAHLLRNKRWFHFLFNQKYQQKRAKRDPLSSLKLAIQWKSQIYLSRGNLPSCQRQERIVCVQQLWYVVDVDDDKPGQCDEVPQAHTDHVLLLLLLGVAPDHTTHDEKLLIYHSDNTGG